MKLTSALMCSLVLVACGNNKSSTPTPTKGEPTAAAANADDEQDRLDDEREQEAEHDGLPNRILVTAADEIETTWLAAQNDGDFQAYIALYGADFAGIRRTPDGAEKTFDLAGWTADRKKMFGNKMEVVVEDDGMDFAGEQGPFTISFTQRWRSGKYADHGQKVLTIDADASGEMKIVREEMLWSKPGWDDTMSDADCAGIVQQLAACGTDAAATKDYKLWLIREIFNGFDDASYFKSLDTELARWKKEPAAVCKEWRSYAEGEPFTFPDPILAAVKSHDCAALRASLDDGNGLPKPADD